MSLVYGLGPADENGEVHEDDAKLIDMIERLGSAEAMLRYADELREWADRTARDPDSQVCLDRLPDGDRWLLEDAEAVGGLFDSIREGLSQGAIGTASDWVALLAPWGFSFGDIDAPVRLWHGAQDGNIPPGQFERAAAAFPHGQLTVWPDAGHLGTAKHWGGVLAAALG
jgi:pimeloyl-ACP methyl ester carboxylesterase